MGRSLLADLLWLVLLPLLLFGWCGGSHLLQVWLDSLAPRLGTGIGVFVVSAFVSFFLLAVAVATVNNRALEHSRAVRATARTASVAGGAAFTGLVLSEFPETEFAHLAGWSGLSLLVLLAISGLESLLTRRELRNAAARSHQEEQQRRAERGLVDGTGP